MSTHIAIVVVGYKSTDDLPECFSSIYQNTYKDFSIFFLDNTETTESADLIARDFPDVTVIANDKNLGFATGNNVMIEAVLKQKKHPDALFLLNPDTIIDKDCLQKLADSYQPDTIVQPLILLHKDGKPTQAVNTWGNPLHYLGFSYAGGNTKSIKEVPEDNTIAVCSGAAVLIPTKIWLELGGFDESFFMYHEDVDLAWRARLLGYKIELAPNALVWHKYAFSRNPKKFFFFERNRMLFMLKNYQFRTLVVLALNLFITDLFMFAYALINGWGIEKLKAIGSGLTMLPGALKARRTIQATRNVTDRELTALMTDSLHFSEVDGAPIKLFNILSKIYWLIARRLI